jgi:hypothetical protein
MGIYFSVEQNRDQPEFGEVKTEPSLGLKLPRHLENRLCLEGGLSKPRAS